MAILWCGGEDIDFPTGTKLVSTDTGRLRPAYSRCALYGGGQESSNLFAGGEVTSAWLSVWGYFSVNPASSYNAFVVGLVGADGLTGYYLYRYTGGKVRIYFHQSGWNILVNEAGTSLVAGGNFKFDMRIENYGAAGRIRVYINGGTIPIIDYSGDITIGSMTGFSRVCGVGGVSSAQDCFSEVIVADEDTRLMNLKTLAPDAAGDTNDWTGAYTDIDETTKSDADLIYTPDKGDDFLCNLTGMPAGTYKVRGVKMGARSADSQGMLGLKVGVKTNAVTHLGEVRGLVPAFAVIEKIYPTNPETATFFTGGEIDALQLALRCDSTTTTTSSSTTTTTS